jgi:outer membrane receptor protein involved in Fe transport
LASAVSAIVGGFGISGTTYAQDQQPGVLEEITVTGSRIVRRDFEANSPITTIDADRFEESSTIAIESVMNQLPQFIPSITQFNPLGPNEQNPGGIAQGATRTPGAANLSLRGLGSNRNLVLIDGRRGMPINAGMAVSINTIPSAAVARVETITGGASSVYGADAISGVVNFILKRDFEGVNINTQYGTTEEGGGEEFTFSMLLGADLAGGDGNFMLGLEMSDRQEILQSEREYWQSAWANAETNRIGGTGFHPRPGVQMIAGNLPSQAAVNALFPDRPNPANVGRTGTFYMNADGSLYKLDPSVNYRYNGPFDDQYGPRLAYDVWTGNLTNWRNNLQFQSPLRRYSVFSRAHLDMSDNLTMFAQFMFNESNNSAIGNPATMTGGWRTAVPHGDGIYAPSLDVDGITTRPGYLPGGRYGLNCAPTGGCTKSQVWPLPPEVFALMESRPNKEADVDLPDVPLWFPVRTSEIDVTMYQVVAGLEGRFPVNNWTWEAFVSHGSNQTHGVYGGMISMEQWRFVTQQPNYGRSLYAVGNELGAGFGAAIINCTSGIPIVWGVSGYGPDYPVSDDCMEALSMEPKNTGSMGQTVVEFNMQGDLASMPAGDLLFALGASYRENDYTFLVDRVNSNRNIVEQASGVFPVGNAIGAIEVKDLYGELVVPLLADKPGFQSMNLELGYRYSRNDPGENIDSYKALLDWRVTDRVRIRGGSQVANRAPNIAELFQSSEYVQALGSNGDWCSDLNPVNPLSPNPTLNPQYYQQARALCEAMMGPVAALNFYSDPLRPNGSGSNEFQLLEGNVNVRPESARTMTAGVVVNITDNVVFTFDYWRIRINDMISNELPSVLYERCLNPAKNPTFDPNFEPCVRIDRDPDSGAHLPTHTTFTNESSIDFSGYDLQLDWGRDVGPGTLTTNVLATISDSVKTRVNVDSQWTEWKGTSGPLDIVSTEPYVYDYRIFTTFGYSTGPWTASLRWRHLPSIESAGNLTTPGRFTPTDAYNIFDAAGRYMLRDNVQVRFGIDNVFDADTEPTFPEPGDNRSAEHQTNARFYDLLGRRAYVGLSVQL